MYSKCIQSLNTQYILQNFDDTQPWASHATKKPTPVPQRDLDALLLLSQALDANALIVRETIKALSAPESPAI